jgi:NAD(P)-dependent dehydrogenase (short-subunit alcohol dehydrogenase family)
MKLADRVAVVTGGARGIGEAIGTRFAAEGATVAVLDLDGAAAAETAGRLAQTAAEAAGRQAAIGAATGTATATGHKCDVSSRASVEAAVAEVLAAHGRVDVLVNNAGIALAGPSETFTDDDWHASIGVMQTGVFLCSQVVGRHMLERGRGTIVNISSINAWAAFPMRLAYCAAKAAVVAMTEVLAIEWAERGIRVNAVAPGVTRTALVQKGIDDGVIDVAAYRARTPMHRFGEPDEIARAVLYLACDEDSSFVTGTTLCADGGWSAMGWVSASQAGGQAASQAASQAGGQAASQAGSQAARQAGGSA